MIAKVIPLIRLPIFLSNGKEKKDFSFFDYLVSKELESEIKFGQIVIVPFRKQKIRGLVVGFKKISKEKNLKEIKKIFFQQSLINEEQLAVIKWLSSFYSASCSTIAKTILPKIITKKNINLSFFEKTIDEKVDLKISKDFVNQARKIINLVNYSKRKKFLLLWQSINQKIALYYFLVKKLLVLKQRILIVVPTLEEAIFIFKHLKKITSNIIIFHSEFSQQEIWQKWQAVINDTADIVITTRLGIFAPIKNLGLIILDNEENNLYKSEQFPYYDARKIVWKISKIDKPRIIFTSQAPRAETYYFTFEQNKFLPLNLRKEEIKKNLVLVDMDREMKKGNFSMISDSLEDSLLEAVKSGKKVLLYLKRKGYATFIFCEDCGRIFNCPHCNLPLKTHKKNNILWLYCHHCSYHEEIPLKCPSCGGTEIKIKGTGIQKISELLGQKYEILKNKISIVDEKTKDGSFPNNQIIITTLPFWRNFDQSNFNNLAFVGLINADIMLSRPDYRSFEETFQELMAIKNWTSFFHHKLIVQTWSKENYAVSDAVTNAFDDFYWRELKTRKEFSYPPFKRVMRLTIQDRNWQRLNTIAENFERDFSKLESKNIKLSPYFAPPRRKMMFEKNYLIKIKNLHPVAPLPDEIKKILPQNSYLDPS
jgi:primosomal protein N' (replication factor Y) (superfamily II helicase)